MLSTDIAIQLFMRRLDDPRTTQVVLSDLAVQAAIAHTVAALVKKGVVKSSDKDARIAAISAGMEPPPMSWRYKLTEAFAASAPKLSAVTFSNNWLSIGAGLIEIAASYAWDGCSPSARMLAGPLLPGGIWIGPWDGPLNADGRPVSWRAYLVYDALCQFRTSIRGLTKDATVRLFARMLREDGAPIWQCSLYPAAEQRFGSQRWREPDGEQPTRELSD